MSGSHRRGITAVTVAALFAFVVPATTASAAPPGNDRAARARVITTIPSRFTVDTSDATRTRSTDVGCVGGHSVWYRFKPKSTLTARAITLGSDYDTILTVFDGAPSARTQIACNDDSTVGSAVQLRLLAGHTYLIALSSCCVDGADDESEGGHGVLRLYRPHPLSLSAPIQGARAGDVSGRALFNGTVRCTNPALWRLSLTISQRVGANVARGAGTLVQACGRTRKPWGIAVDSVTGVAFRPGRAVLTVNRSVDDGFTQKATTASFVVRLGTDPHSSTGRSHHAATLPQGDR